MPNRFQIVSLLTFLTICLSGLDAQLVTLPQASPAASVSQVVGISEVTVDYSRPSVNGRQIWGGIVPFGYADLGWAGATESPWRAGANENTVLTLQHDATIEGEPIPAGSYGLHLAIAESGEVTVILSNNFKSWGSYFYDPSEDALRVTVQWEEAPFEEQLAYEFSDISKNAATLSLHWEKKRIPIRIGFNTDAIVVASLKQQMRDSHGFRYQNIMDAANYLLANEIELELALEWATIAIERPWVGRRLPETLELKARILEKLGRESEAKALRREIDS